MANKFLITNTAKLTQVEQVYYAPVAIVPPANNTITQTYCFLSRAEPWETPDNPPVPTQDVKSLKNIYKNIFVVKHVTSNDISPVIARRDWTANTVYDSYKDTLDMNVQDENNNPFYKFYVKNRYDQVFKCLWNKNGAPSTEEPYFEPGVYGNNNIFQGSDGYKWKFMYTIDTGLKLKFMDASWMPIPVGRNVPNAEKTSIGSGGVEVINVLEGGLFYDPANAVVSVAITGDGTGASATAEVSESGVVTDIIVTNTGSNYTYANSRIVSSLGQSAVLETPLSPVGGHGYDPISELGCSHVMYSVQFNGSEGGKIPTEIDYYQIGLIANPSTKTLLTTNDTYVPATGAIYKTTTDTIVAPGFGAYVPDEIVYQGDSLETATFFATVLYFDTASNIINLLNITGTPTINAPLNSTVSKTTRTLLSYSQPDFSLFSGYITHIENRSSVTRSSDGIEQYKFVLGY